VGEDKLGAAATLGSNDEDGDDEGDDTSKGPEDGSSLESKKKIN
jgi:hypothetical protein